MALLQSGMTVGEGDMYQVIESECYSAIMGIINNPDHELYGLLSYPDLTRQVLSMFVYSESDGVWYDPYSSQGGTNSDKYDLLGGEYSDILSDLEMLGNEMGIDCGSQLLTILNSHQGSAGI